MAFTDFGSFNFTNAVEGTRAFPVTNVPVGTTALQAVIARGQLDPAVVLTWSFDLSLDNGVTWLPWGAAGTNGGTVIRKDGSIATESYYQLNLPRAADAQTRIRGSLTNTGARMTTTISIRGDTTPLLLMEVSTHRSIVIENFITVEGDAVTTLTTASFSISSSDRRGGLMLVTTAVGGSVTYTGISGSIGGTTATAVSGADSGTFNTAGAGATARALIYYADMPPSGSQTATFSISPTSGTALGVLMVTNGDPQTPTNNGTGTATSTTATSGSINVATRGGDLTAAACMPQNVVTGAAGQLRIYLSPSANGSEMCRGQSNTSSDTYSWTMASGIMGIAGCNLRAAPTDYSFANFPAVKLQVPDRISE